MYNKLLLTVVLSIVGCNLNAQILATQESAKKSKKAIMTCSSYQVVNSNGIQNENGHDVEVSWYQSSNKVFSISVSGVGLSYEFNSQDFYKSENDEMMEKQIVIYDKKDTDSTPKFIYNCSIGSGGVINSVFMIVEPSNNLTYSFPVEKCVFITKDGQSYNYYCDRTNSLDADLLYTFFKSRKIKNESSIFSSFLRKIKNK